MEKFDGRNSAFDYSENWFLITLCALRSLCYPYVVLMLSLCTYGEIWKKCRNWLFRNSIFNSPLRYVRCLTFLMLSLICSYVVLMLFLWQNSKKCRIWLFRNSIVNSPLRNIMAYVLMLSLRYPYVLMTKFGKKCRIWLFRNFIVNSSLRYVVPYVSYVILTLSLCSYDEI